MKHSRQAPWPVRESWQECLLPELTACIALWQSPELCQRAEMAVREPHGVADLPCLCVTQAGEHSCKHHVCESERS